MEKTDDSSNENGSKTWTVATLLGPTRTSTVPSLPNPTLPGTPCCPSLPYTQLDTGTVATLLGPTRGGTLSPIPNTPFPGTTCSSLPSELEIRTVASSLFPSRDSPLPFHHSPPSTEQVTVATLPGLGRGTSLATKAIMKTPQ